MKSLLKSIALLALMFVPLLSSSWGQAEPRKNLVPKEARIKIDNVDVSRAPEMRIRATMLDGEGKTPSVDEVVFDVFDGSKERMSLLTSGLKANAFFDVDAPLDLAVVVPLSARFTADQRQYFVDTLKAILEISRARSEGLSVPDRFAGLFDTGIEIHDGTTSAKAKEAILNVLQTADQFEAHLDLVAGGGVALGQLSFLYSGIEKAINTLADVDERNRSGYENARRCILVITDGFDSFAYKKDDVEGTIYDIAKAAREYGITIYTVSYNSKLKSLNPLFEGMSRKTGGTYREVTHARSSNVCDAEGTVCTEAKNAYGEMLGQYVIDFRHPSMHDGQTVQYKLRARCVQGENCWDEWQEAESSPYAPMTVGKLEFNWRAFRIACLILGGLAIVAVIVFLIMRKRRQRRELEDAARAEQELAEKIERGEVCPKCHRSMMPDWKECLFCAREMAEEVNKAKEAMAAEKTQKSGNAKKTDQRACPNCGRTLMPQWKECLFCKAGIGSDSAPKKGIAPMADKKKESAPAASDERICPVCHRTMKPHWTVCLYCEADAGNRPMTAPVATKQEIQDAPATPEVRICPTCGRPMKAHWTTCLYCEADRTR